MVEQSKRCKTSPRRGSKSDVSVDDFFRVPCVAARVGFNHLCSLVPHATVISVDASTAWRPRTHHIDRRLVAELCMCQICNASDAGFAISSVYTSDNIVCCFSQMTTYAVTYFCHATFANSVDRITPQEKAFLTRGLHGFHSGARSPVQVAIVTCIVLYAALRWVGNICSTDRSTHIDITSGLQSEATRATVYVRTHQREQLGGDHPVPFAESVNVHPSETTS